MNYTYEHDERVGLTSNEKGVVIVFNVFTTNLWCKKQVT